MNQPYHYPAGPTSVDPGILEPSAEFRKEVKRVIFSILMFIGSYILLCIGGFALAALSAYGGFLMLTNFPGLWTLIFGIGMAGLGILVVVFLVKFIFKTKKVDRSRMTEITEKDQPALFDFLKELAKETHTQLPKKVYLTPDVNASVFYDSGFWSMFFPIRKNLNIGLGLVNTVNVSEFKAVIAHEFGHFSQKSMKLGSYVYNVNHVIYDMLYDNRDYDETLETFSNISSIFGFFGLLTNGIVSVIKGILQQLYEVINKRYLALSRQMEFHADAVAASVTGSLPLISALNRLQIADQCLQKVLSLYGEWVPDGRKGLNIYTDQVVVMRQFSRDYNIGFDHNLLQISGETFERYNRSRVVVKDQWASHPSTADREAHLRQLNIAAAAVNDSAWTLFHDAEKLQQQMTISFYEGVSFQEGPHLMDAEAFERMFHERIDKYKYNKAYQGFYDDRALSTFDVDRVISEEPVPTELSEVITDSIRDLPNKIRSVETDIQMLENVLVSEGKIKTFDFEGTKHKASEAKRLIPQLKKELAALSENWIRADKAMFRLYYQKAKLAGRGDEAIAAYKKMLSVSGKAEGELKLLNSMIKEASQLFGQVTIGVATAVSNNMTREGSIVKDSIRQMLADAEYVSFYTLEDKTLLESFLKDRREYFFNTGLDGEAINLHMQAFHVYGRIISEHNFRVKKGDT